MFSFVKSSTCVFVLLAISGLLWSACLETFDAEGKTFVCFNDSDCFSGHLCQPTPDGRWRCIEAGANVCARGEACCGDDCSAQPDDCVDLLKSLAHCGRCDNACDAGDICGLSPGGVIDCISAREPYELPCVPQPAPGTAQDAALAFSADCPHGEYTYACVDALCIPLGLLTLAELEKLGRARKDETPCGGAPGAALFCRDGEVCCEQVCRDVTVDDDHCGVCGHSCAATETCEGGSCLCGDPAEVCAEGSACCGEADGERCVDLSKDLDHCGLCGRVCEGVDSEHGSTAERCSAGACRCDGEDGLEECLGSQACCGTGCEDLQSDPANCGACGVACVEGEACVDGACWCGSASSATGAGSFCQGSNASSVCCKGSCISAERSTCSCGVEVPVHCPEGMLCCEEQCVDPATDADNCGACGEEDSETTCPLGEFCQPNVDFDAEQPLGDDNRPGLCQFACAKDRVMCLRIRDERESERYCADPRTDLSYCGARLPSLGAEATTGGCSSDDAADPNYRGEACASDEFCRPGADKSYHCEVYCGGVSSGLIVCEDLNEGTRRCVDPSFDDQFCGAARRQLADPEQTGQCDAAQSSSDNFWGVDCHNPDRDASTNEHIDAVGCLEGRCVIVECSVGWANCDGDPLNGCECASP